MMKKNRHLLSEVWEEFPEQLTDGYSELVHIPLGKYLADILAIGPSYYYVLNVIDNTLQQVSENILQIHGLAEYPVFLNDVIALVHPDDVEFVVRAEKATFKELNKIGFQHKKELKTSYCFRMKVADGSYHLFHHQVNYLVEDEKKRFLGALNIHTDIQHITKENSYTVLICGIGGRSDYIQIDLSEKTTENGFIQFTKREMEVLLHLAKGLSSTAIAEKLFISSHTVRIHRKNLLKKAGVANTGTLVKRCIEIGLI